MIRKGVKMAKKVIGTLISRSEIEKMVAELGARITRDYAGKEILLIGVLRGAFIFMADLVRQIKLDCKVDFIAVSSYGADTKSSGIVRIDKDVSQNIAGQHVIIVEDIIDSGLTLKKLTELLSTRNPASIALCTAFDKPERRKVDIHVDYSGMVIPDRFIVGYGLDFAESYRNLDEVCILGEDEEN